MIRETRRHLVSQSLWYKNLHNTWSIFTYIEEGRLILNHERWNFNSFFTKLTDSPTIKTIPDQSIKTGDKLSITCQLTSSNPTPSEYKWTKVDDGTFSQTGPVLTIPNIQFHHTGTYRCTVVNTMIPTSGGRQQGSDTEDVIVDVLCMYTSSIV